jgi:glycosyltransferase involved in cell wall biosynthesis/ubiquinone/menaquinone biosynthesis C-methylase UbiE
VDTLISNESRPLQRPAVTGEAPRYIYVADSDSIGVLFSKVLGSLSERHRIRLDPPALRASTDVLAEVSRHKASGLIFELQRGWPNRRVLMLSWNAVRAGVTTYFYWPKEEAIELIDRYRLASMARLFLFVTACRLSFPIFGSRDFAANFEIRHRVHLQRLQNNAAPVPLTIIGPSGHKPRIDGLGVYLRMDYWNHMRAGGSYGHTCYMAKELAQVTREFICLMGCRFELLDEMGLRQIVVSREFSPTNERDMLDAGLYYYDRLRTLFEVHRPAYVYERLVLGNYAGARLCQDLKIPYLVEYNGSEIVMRRIFGDGRGYRYKNLLLTAEKAAFDQATVITVVSDAVREVLVEAGVDAGKILVNPNCADPAAYAPGTADEIAQLRRHVGWTRDRIVIGFVGTFGGWHGIETLAESLPRIAAALPEARFLIVGRGPLQSLIIETLDRMNLNDRVYMPGMLSQRETAELMKVCDIFVSPHHNSMGKLKFFGSPTKVFEYMAIGGAIVASDLEQIGEVLSPALRSADLVRNEIKIVDQRAVLVQPGNLEEFVAAVTGLARRPDIRAALGANARQAVLDRYSWPRHVERLLDFVQRLAEGRSPEAGQGGGSATITAARGVDPLKREIVRQWDGNPCGSQHPSLIGKTHLDWFREVERFRYVDYAPWMPRLMEFADHKGDRVLEIGGGLGTDLAQFAAAGAQVADFDMSIEHLKLARENFDLRGLTGQFVGGDGETLPFGDNTFDLVYTNGVIHHTPNTKGVIDEIHRVLRPGGKVICMVYAEASAQFWRDLVYRRGLREGQLLNWSMGEIMSRCVEVSETDTRPLVKVYGKRQLADLFQRFSDVQIHRRQLTPQERPWLLRWIPASQLQKAIGWNLVVKARKPGS